MCCIIIKYGGQKLPSKRMLKAVFNANRDGIGFVSETDFYKTMDFEDFYQRVKRVPLRENLIIHFRYATHGSVGIKNCHPFKDGDIYFAHNGVLPIPSKNDMTDSEICFRERLMPCIRKYGIEDCESLIESQRCTSRFAFMVKGEIFTYGKYYEINGCYYSNLNFYKRYLYTA